MISIVRIKELRLVRKGDLFIRNQAEGMKAADQIADESALPVREVGDVKVGRKNVSLFDTDGKEFVYAMMDQPVAILASEKTEAEQKAERDDRVRKHLVEELEDGLLKNDPVALFEALKTGRNDEDRTQYSGFVFNIMDDLLLAQAKFDLLRSVNALYTEDGRPSKGDIIDAFARVLASELEPSRSSGRALSRSTSVTANLAADVRREVALAMLDDWMAAPVKVKVFEFWARRNG